MQWWLFRFFLLSPSCGTLQRSQERRKGLVVSPPSVCRYTTPMKQPGTAVIAAHLALLAAGSGAATNPAPSAEAAAETAIARVQAVDPKIHAVLALDPTALDHARAIDRRRKARGLLYGYAILLKDNIETDGPLPTTAGSMALLEQCDPSRRPPGRAAARSRRRDPWQDESLRMGKHSLQRLHLRLERRGRPDP